MRTILLIAALAALGVTSRAADPVAKTSVEERESQLIAVLESDAPAAEKAITCKQLALYGGKRAIPALAKLLDNPELASWARIGLEANPDPAVDAALRGSLDRLQGELLVGVINALGSRRDAEAVKPLLARLKDKDPQVAAAAAVALGRIANPAATEALAAALGGTVGPVRGAVAEGLIYCAERALTENRAEEAVGLYDQVRQADVPKPRLSEATRGAILARGQAGLPLLAEQLRATDEDQFAIALRVARELGGVAVAEMLVAELGKLQPSAPPTAQPLVIRKAQYGAGEQWADVTDALNALVFNNSIAVEANNALAGDPASGKVKELRVTYVLGGQEKTAVVPEGQTFQLGEGGALVGDPREIALVYALGDVGQAPALPALLKAAQGGSWGARVAAVRVLGRIGDAAIVPALLEAAQGGGQLGQAAIESLDQLEGEAVDQAIAARLPAAEGQARAVLIQLVGFRGIKSASAALLKDVESQDEAVRLAALGALGMTAGFEQLDTLIEHLVAAPSPREAEVARTALLSAATRMTDRDATARKLLAALAAAPAERKAALLEVASAVGGAQALAGVAAAARAGDDTQQDAASRVLGEWMSADAAPVLLELARSGNPKYRIRALRGYLRIARQLDLPLSDRMAICRDAAAVAQRDEEKKLILEILRRYPAAEGLGLAVAYLGEPTLRTDAADSALAIGEKLLPSDRAAVAAAMRAVLQTRVDAQQAARAKALLEQASR